MDTSRALTLVEQLEDNIEDLEEALQPVLTQALSETTKKLPLLDRAKLNVTIVYALGSLIFSYLKLHGVDAKNHKVFTELTRVKQYFEKIKIAEGGSESAATLSTSQTQPGPNLRLDKPAAARIFKHDLAETDKEILARAEAEARQKFLANRKLKALEASMKAKAAAKDTQMTDIDADAQLESPITELLMEETQAEQPSPSAQLVASLVAAAEAGEITLPAEPKTPTPATDNTSTKSNKKKDKKRKRVEQEAADLEDGEVDETKVNRSKKANKKQRKREAERARAAAMGQDTTGDNNG